MVSQRASVVSSKVSCSLDTARSSLAGCCTWYRTYPPPPALVSSAVRSSSGISMRPCEALASSLPALSSLSAFTATVMARAARATAKYHLILFSVRASFVLTPSLLFLLPSTICLSDRGQQLALRARVVDLRRSITTCYGTQFYERGLTTSCTLLLKIDLVRRCGDARTRLDLESERDVASRLRFCLQLRRRAGYTTRTTEDRASECLSSGSTEESFTVWLAGGGGRSLGQISAVAAASSELPACLAGCKQLSLSHPSSPAAAAAGLSDCMKK